MLEVRYSENEDVDISGTSSEFQLLQQKLLGMIDQGKNFLHIEVSVDFDSNPYDEILESLEFKEADANEVLIDSQILIVRGTKEFLNHLAINFPIDVGNSSLQGSYHIHYD